MAGGGGGSTGFDVGMSSYKRVKDREKLTCSLALQRRQALMGASGPRALVKNFKVFSIALFACLGGVLYGYNQGMFSGILAMPSFGKRELHFQLLLRLFINTGQRRTATLTIRHKKDG
jgi:hypothetical protein